MSLHKSMKGKLKGKNLIRAASLDKDRDVPVDQERSLYEIQLQLCGLAALFENLGYSEFSEEQLKGIGQMLNRLAQAMERVRGT